MPYRLNAHAARWLLGLSALTMALTTSAEIVTAPYSPWVAVYSLNAAVHVAKALAIVGFSAGLLTLVAHEAATLGRWGTAAGVALGVFTVLGAGPYTVVEATLPADVTAARADRLLNAAYDAQPWISPLSSIAMPVIVLSIVTLGVVALRRGLWPRWVPVVSLVSIPLGAGLFATGQAIGFPVPHPPAWLMLGLAGYAFVLASDPGPGQRSVTSRVPAGRTPRSSG